MAGYETSANTLAMTLSFLSVYPDVQERWYQQIKEHVKAGELPVGFTPSWPEVTHHPDRLMAICQILRTEWRSYKRYYDWFL